MGSRVNGKLSPVYPYTWHSESSVVVLTLARGRYPFPIDSNRVLNQCWILHRRSRRSATRSAKGPALSQLRDGKVSRTVHSWDRERVLAVGLASEDVPTDSLSDRVG